MTPQNPFIIDHVPHLLWPWLIEEFGADVDYIPQGDTAQTQTITIVWNEGASDEDVSPGRYSHIKIRNADLIDPPRKGDQVAHDGRLYDVVDMTALPYNFSVCILQETGPFL
jgi:hypothetical protein